MAKNLNSQDCYKYRKIDIQVEKKTKLGIVNFQEKNYRFEKIKYDKNGELGILFYY